MKKSVTALLLAALILAIVFRLSGQSQALSDPTAPVPEATDAEAGATKPRTEQNAEFTEPETEAERTIRAYAQAQGLSPDAWPQSLIELLDRNPETLDFVLNYPEFCDETQQADLTEFENCDTVPLFLQWDARWGYRIYGSDVLGITGCGPTCLAMAGYYLTGDTSFSPDKVAEFAETNGYYVPGNGSSWTLISQGGEKLGLDVTEIPLEEKRIKDNLEVGNPIICAVGPGDFTTSGHYIVLAGLEDGLFVVNDPNSRENSQQRWSYGQLAEQIRNLWVIR